VIRSARKFVIAVYLDSIIIGATKLEILTAFFWIKSSSQLLLQPRQGPHDPHALKNARPWASAGSCVVTFLLFVNGASLQSTFSPRCYSSCMNKTTQQLVAEANAVIETVSIATAIDLLGSDEVIFVDIREPDELVAEGFIPGSIHVPRGKLEWVAESSSPWHHLAFSSGKKLLLYCAGAGRSALATKQLQDMGFSNVAHVEGGIHRWIAERGPVTRVESTKNDLGD
jgi:rhodanese-related sulfurtransferase